MSLAIAITLIVLLDLALLAGLAYAMAAPRRLRPHLHAGDLRLAPTAGADAAAPVPVSAGRATLAAARRPALAN